MNSEQIGTEVQTELNKLIQTVGVDNFKFGIADQVSTIQPVAKTIIWYDANPNNIKRIYKGVCEKLQLPYNDELEGQYIYIKVSF